MVWIVTQIVEVTNNFLELIWAYFLYRLYIGILLSNSPYTEYFIERGRI